MKPLLICRDREVWRITDISDCAGAMFAVEPMRFLWPSEAKRLAARGRR